MSWQAKEIHAALEAALEDYGLGDLHVEIQVREPAAGTGGAFVVQTRRGDRRLRHELPAALGHGYLADEEAAVDEFKRWVDDWIRSQSM
ncbi:MAG: hypothetical protein ACREKI_08230 [Gemmatimonadota bacterium]